MMESTNGDSSSPLPTLGAGPGVRELPADRWYVSESLRRETVRIARDLRQRQTRSEQLLWERLRRKQLAGVKFRRQYPIGPFVVDFCAPSARLIIELDGGVHAQTRERDAERQTAIERLGFRFLRFPAERVERDLEGVIGEIRDWVRDFPLPPAPSPIKGEGEEGRS